MISFSAHYQNTLMYNSKLCNILLPLALSFLVLPCLSFNHNPKIYVDVDCIELVDPLRHGFNIVVPKKLFETYLDPFQLPLMYVTAVPLNGKGVTVREMVYLERLPDKTVTLTGLEEKSWYYVCLEFENMHRHRRQGNTSTSCQVHRTLDQFGTKAESPLQEVRFSTVTDSVMEFALDFAASFPLLLDVYLEGGPSPIQTFHLAGPPQAVRVAFSHLLPGHNYGRLCIVERPLLQAYTALGRSISVTKSSCHLDNLETVAWRVAEKQRLAKDEPIYRKLRTVSSGWRCERDWRLVAISLVVVLIGIR